MKHPKSVTVFILFVFITISGFTQNKNIKTKILKAINEGARCASDVLLDEDGKSKGDYYITKGEWRPYEPAWHTGQIIYALTEAYRITGNKKQLEEAKRAGNWWISLEIKNVPEMKGLIKAVHGNGIENIIFATISDGSAGLYRLSKASNDKKYAKVATGAGDWLYRNTYDRENGVCFDNIDPNTGEVLKENSPFWPEKSHQELYDVARPNTEGSLFLDMYRFTNKEEYKTAFIELCNSLVEKQWENGLWMDFTPNNKEKHYFHPRFNLWYAESLLDCYDLTKDKKYLKAALKTATTYANIQAKDGTIYYRNYTDGTPPDKTSICGSTVSFAGIIWLRLMDLGQGVQFEKNIQRSVNWVLKNRFPSNHPDPNLRGAFLNTRTKKKKGEVRIINRDVGTSFGIRFLVKYYDHYLSES
jgi:hypothetical protein